MTPRPAEGGTDTARHVGRAAQFALVAAALLTIVGLGLGFLWVHATTPVQGVIISVLLSRRY